MPPFQYVPWSSPDIPSIASLIAHQADPYARAAEATAAANAHAREVSGDVWGRAIQQIGQLPNQIMAQSRENAESAQKRALLGSEIQKNQQDVAARDRAVKGQQLLGTLAQQYTTTDPITGVRQTDHQAIANDLTQAGYPDAAEGWLKTTTANADALEKLNDLKRKTAETIATAVGHAAHDAGDAGDFLSRIGHLHLEGVIDAPTAQKFAEQAQQDWPAFQKRTVEWASSLSKPIEVKKDTELLDPITRTPIYKAPDKLTNETELALAAADPTHPLYAKARAAMDLQRAQRNPPSIEDQYLKALADGKTDAAAMIRQTWEDKAKASRDPNAAAQLAAIRNLSQQEAQARLDDRDQTSNKNQQKFEQEYRTVLTRAMSSRAGGLGGEDAKVQQANHLLALMDQYVDPKTGDYAIPRVQLNELALGLAKLTAGSSPAGEGMLKEFQQRTLKGDIAGALTFLTGQAVPANTQDITKMLRDSIERQGGVAEQNREGEMRYLRGLAPTDLAESRRTALEANTLNPLRQSRTIENKQTGERKIQVSTDGGKTWK